MATNGSIPKSWSDKLIGQMDRAIMSSARDCAVSIKEKGRDRIRATTKGERFANAWRVKAYPNKWGRPMDPFVVAYHKTTYGGIFEEGGQIKPARARFLWIPLPSVKKLLNVKIGSFTDKTTKVRTYLAGRLAAKGAQLVFIPPMNGHPPMLAAKYGVTKKGRFSKFGGPREQQSVLTPLFIGRSLVTIRTKWEMEKMANAEWAKMNSLVGSKLEG